MKLINKQGKVVAPTLGESVDLDALFDGSTYELAKGEDFACAPSTAAQLVRDEYRKRYGRLVVRVIESTGAVEVTATPGALWRK